MQTHFNLMLCLHRSHSSEMGNYTNKFYSKIRGVLHCWWPWSFFSVRKWEMINRTQVFCESFQVMGLKVQVCEHGDIRHYDGGQKLSTASITSCLFLDVTNYSIATQLWLWFKSISWDELLQQSRMECVLSTDSYLFLKGISVLYVSASRFSLWLSSLSVLQLLVLKCQAKHVWFPVVQVA